MDYYTMMTMRDVPEDRLRSLASQLREKSAHGGQLSTSTIEPVASQGRLMQAQTAQNARDVGLQRARVEREKTDRAKSQALLTKALGHSLGDRAAQKFEDKAATISKTASLAASFSDDYSGELYLSGRAEEALGRMGAGTETMKNMGEWWSDWKQHYENVVRHDLFGSALTASEKDEWRKANINSDMPPEMIRSKLSTLNRLNKIAAAREVSNKLNRGVDFNYIYGVYRGIVPEEAWDGLVGFEDDLRATVEEGSDMARGRRKVEELSNEELLLMLQEYE